MSNYLENALVNGTIRGITYTAPTTVYLALYTSNPTDADTGTEVSGVGYARKIITFGAPSNGVSTNSALIEFPIANSAWGTVGWVAIRDALTAGNMLYYTPLDVSKTITAGDTFRINSNNLSVTLA